MITRNGSSSCLFVEIVQHWKHNGLDQDVGVEVPIVLGFVDSGGNGVHGIDVGKTIGVSLEIGDDPANRVLEETNDVLIVGEQDAAVVEPSVIDCRGIPEESEFWICSVEDVFGGEQNEIHWGCCSHG